MSKPDPSDMYSMIRGYPKQFEKGFRLAEHVQLPSEIKNVVVAGMGGSALAPDVVFNFFQDQLAIPHTVHRSYGLPAGVSRGTLVIVISFSGNTAETISAFTAAMKRDAQVVVITSGGQLETQARERNIPLVRLEKESDNFQPRMSSGYIIAIVTQLLINAGILNVSARQRILSAAYALDKMYLPQLGKQIADLMKGHLPIIYTADEYWPVARIAKIKINENTKIPCFWNVLPEMNHNEMVGFTNPGKVKYFLLMLKDPESDSRINQRMDTLARTLKGRGIKSLIIEMPGETKFEKTLGSLMLADWVSYWLALEMKIDPTPVDMVEEFKTLMSQ